MHSLQEISSDKTLVILRGEYAIILGDDQIIASPDAKKGEVLVICDSKRKITLMAHFDNFDHAEKELDKILLSLRDAGWNPNNGECHLVGGNRLASLLSQHGLDPIVGVSQEKKSFNVVADNNGEILTDNSKDTRRVMLNNVMFFDRDSEKRVIAALDIKKTFPHLSRVEPHEEIFKPQVTQPFVQEKEND